MQPVARNTKPHRTPLTLSALTAASILALAADSASAQTAYGINSQGQMFSFNVKKPYNSVSMVGNVGFVPEGLDFAPGTQTLYAVDMDYEFGLVRLYTINTATGAPTQIGSGLPISGTDSQGDSWDFRPQAPGAGGKYQGFGVEVSPNFVNGSSYSIRIYSSAGSDVAMNTEGTGLSPNDHLEYAFNDPNTGKTPNIHGMAYSQNIPFFGLGGGKQYVLDQANNTLAYVEYGLFSPGLTTVGPLFSVQTPFFIDTSGFDIYTDPILGTDEAYAVMRLRSGDDTTFPYVFYGIDLGDGSAFGGVYVREDGVSGAPPMSFEGGFAIMPAVVPEPSTLGLVGLAALPLLQRRRTLAN